ncbi:MAG: hypothetical protein SFY56_15490 [Bacteroidota bacterium]|nr:hypothetical protein [Bacteroidota bacterium]
MKTIIVFISIILLQSCMLTSKMDKIVSRHYASAQAITSLDNRNAIPFNIDSLPKINGFCKSRYSDFYVIPLIIYTYSCEKIVCEINPKYYVNATMNELNNLIERDANQLKLENKSLQLIFKKIPNSFIHKFDANSFAFQYFIIPISGTIAKEKMYYDSNEIVVDYIIRDKSTKELIKKGRIIETVTSVFDSKALIDTRWYFVETFVNSYDRAMRYASYSVAQKIVNEL